MLLAAYRLRRPTKDIDLAASGLGNDPGVVHEAIRDVIRIDVDDGLEFDLASSVAQTIREDGTYSGVRVTVPCRLSSARVDFHVDVNLGDPVEPPATTLPIPRLLGGEPLSVTGYSISMVLAEKIVTAMERGTAHPVARLRRHRRAVSSAHRRGRGGLAVHPDRSAVSGRHPATPARGPRRLRRYCSVEVGCLATPTPPRGGATGGVRGVASRDRGLRRSSARGGRDEGHVAARGLSLGRGGWHQLTGCSRSFYGEA